MSQWTEMELRVANAIGAELLEGTGTFHDAGMILRCARAAIRAMREPTKEMLACQDSLPLDDLAWRDMIDAASPPA